MAIAVCGAAGAGAMSVAGGILRAVTVCPQPGVRKVLVEGLVHR